MASMSGSQIIPWATIIVAASYLFAPEATAQISRKPLKPTELVVKEYEDFVAKGLLLTSDGWKQVSHLWETSDPFSAQGEIGIRSAGGAIGEDWVRGNRARVETKWNDLYGKIDSSLRFTPAAANGTGVAMIQQFDLICVDSKLENEKSIDASVNEGCSGKWKLAGRQQSRAATIPMAIRYVTEMRDKTTNPVVRNNADRTIDTLKRLSPGCGTASAC